MKKKRFSDEEIKELNRQALKDLVANNKKHDKKMKEACREASGRVK